MEESVKRRERLNAMRMEATESGSYSEAQSSSMGHSLTNPLIESSHVQVESYVSPRFDYYTDPMAAFSANKNRNNNNNVGPQVSQQPCFTPPRPMNPRSPIYPPRGNYPIDQRPFQSQGVHHTFSPLASPGQSSPLGMPPPRNSPNAWGSSVGPPMNYYPPNSSTGGNFASPGFHQGGRPDFHYGQSRGQPASGYRGSPYQGSGHRGSPYQGQGHRGSPYQGQGHRGSPYQGSGHRGSPYQDSGRGSPYQGSGHRGSPYQDSGRGRGRGMGNSASPVPFQSGRRELGSHESASSQYRPNKYYNKLMVEDPWKLLKPVIWKPIHASSLDTPDSQNSWLPKSVCTKKPKLTEAPVKSSPQQSLAEYLAASLKEAAGKDAVNDEFGT